MTGALPPQPAATPEVSLEAPEADAVEQQTPVEEAAPIAGSPVGTELDAANEADLIESRQEVPIDEDERR